jgi:dihydropteroate synthase
MLKNSQLILNGRALTWGERTYVMGILNITPDSFSGDGLIPPDTQGRFAYSGEIEGTAWVQAALDQAGQFVAAGADILDVGGESTRPGALPVDSGEELARVLPVVRALTSEFEIPVSIDTYRAQVAEAALQAGASMVNDVWGLHADPDLAGVIARWEVPVVLMHNRSSWAHAQIKERLGGRYVGIPYDNLLEDVKRELQESVAIATQAGISSEKIILDPGIGFGKSVKQNLELIDRLQEIRALGYPVLLGPSRKSFIGYTLDLPPDERLEGTAAAVAVGIVRGADIVRVHDVQQIVRVVRMTDAIVRRYNLTDS